MYNLNDNKKRREVEEELERLSMTVMLFITGFIILTAVHIINWDKYALEIIPLTVKDWVGKTTPADWEKKAAMCTDLKNWDCVENELERIAKNDPKQYLRLGQLQFKRAKLDRAARSFAIYFKRGGRDLEAMYSYALALSELGQAEEASRFFEAILESRSKSLQLPVIRNYVRMLIRHHRYDHARRLITRVRNSNPRAELFMEQEYRQIKKLMTASRD